MGTWRVSGRLVTATCRARWRRPSREVFTRVANPGVLPRSVAGFHSRRHLSPRPLSPGPTAPPAPTSRSNRKPDGYTAGPPPTSPAARGALAAAGQRPSPSPRRRRRPAQPSGRPSPPGTSSPPRTSTACRPRGVDWSGARPCPHDRGPGSRSVAASHPGRSPTSSRGPPAPPSSRRHAGRGTRGPARRPLVVWSACAQGWNNSVVAARPGVSRDAVRRRRTPFPARRLDGLADGSRPLGAADHHRRPGGRGDGPANSSALARISMALAELRALSRSPARVQLAFASAVSPRSSCADAKWSSTSARL